MHKASAAMTHRDVKDLNLRFFQLVREVGQTNEAEAALRFGLEPEVIQQIMAARWESIEALCSRGRISYQVIIPEESLSELSAAG